MENFEKIIESKVKVRFPDCDPFNHLNNSRYIDYFLNAREDQVLSYYDFNIHKIAMEQGISWVVAQNQIAYLMPAMLMETVVIQTRLLEYGDRHLLMEAFMWNEEKMIVKSILWSRFVHFNLKAKKTEIHSPTLMEFFKQIENPLSEECSFEKRIEKYKYPSVIDFC